MTATPAPSATTAPTPADTNDSTRSGAEPGAPRTAVLLSGHGSVERSDEIPAFLQNIRRGRPTPASIVAEVTHRFERIGGSPLRRISAEQAAALASRLGLPVVAAGRLWHPYIADVVDDLVARGIERIVSLPMAPQSVHLYHASLVEACDARKIAGKFAPSVIEVPPWGTEPALLSAFSTSIDQALERLEASKREDAAILLSFHSLPTRVIAMGDPYEQQIRQMCDALIARRHEPSRHVEVVFQSQGMDGGEWLGPDLRSTFARLAGEGRDTAVIAPLGFLAEHTEVLYDLDIEARELAGSSGIHLERAPSLNTAPGLLDALETLVYRALGRDGRRALGLWVSAS